MFLKGAHDTGANCIYFTTNTSMCDYLKMSMVHFFVSKMNHIQLKDQLITLI